MQGVRVEGGSGTPDVPLSHPCCPLGVLGMQEAGGGLSFPTRPAPMDGTLA